MNPNFMEIQKPHYCNRNEKSPVLKDKRHPFYLSQPNIHKPSRSAEPSLSVSLNQELKKGIEDFRQELRTILKASKEEWERWVTEKR